MKPGMGTGDGMTTQDDVLQKLTGILREGVDIHRCAAATALGQIKAPDALDALIDAMRDEDEDVRTDAAAALALMQDERAAEQLMDNLINDPIGEVKVAALETLTRMGHEPLVPWLRKLALSRDEEIVWDEDEFYAGGWDDWIDIQVKSIEALVAFNCEDAVPDIVEAMQDEMGQDLTDVGFKALVQLGETGIAAAAGALNAKNVRLRRRVVRQLATVDSPAARDALVKALADEAVEVRLLALDALAEREPSAPELATMFDDPSDEVREMAVKRVGPAMPARLSQALADKTHRVRRAVLSLLAEQPDLMNSDDVVPVARKFLDGDAPKTAAVAAAALAALDPENAVAALSEQVLDSQRFPEVRLAALRSLIKLGDPAATETLSVCIADSDRQIRLEALAGLGGLAGGDAAWPNDAGDVLIQALSAEIDEGTINEGDTPGSEELPDPAVETLERQDEPVETEEVVAQPEEQAPAKPDAGPGSTLEAILGADSPELQVVRQSGDKVELSPKDLEFLGLAQRKLKKRKLDPVPKIAAPLDARRFAARVLGDVARPEVAEALVAQVRSADMELAVNALNSLVRIGEAIEQLPEVVEKGLLDLLNGKEEERRLPALRALAYAGGDAAQHALKVALGDPDSFLRLEAVRALAKTGNFERDTMIDMLADTDASVRLAAAEALADKADGPVLQRLTDFTFAFEGYHHRETARLLRRLDPMAASERYLEVLGEDERKREWQVAIAALGEVNEADQTSV